MRTFFWGCRVCCCSCRALSCYDRPSRILWRMQQFVHLMDCNRRLNLHSLSHSDGSAMDLKRTGVAHEFINSLFYFWPFPFYYNMVCSALVALPSIYHVTIISISYSRVLYVQLGFVWVSVLFLCRSMSTVRPVQLSAINLWKVRMREQGQGRNKTFITRDTSCPGVGVWLILDELQRVFYPLWALR